MMTPRRATPILSAVVLAGLALSGCATKEAAKEATKEATSSASSVMSSAASSASSGAAATTSVSAAKPAGEKVPAADLPALVKDRTYSGLFNGKPYKEYYAPDGSLRGTSEGEAYTGSWKVVGEQVCFTYSSQNTTDCYDVFKNGEEMSWIGPGGTLEETTVVEGNPDGL